MKWEQFNFQPWIGQRLAELKFSSPTKIQSLVFQEQAKQQNLVVTSPTGSGKTFAFLLPILNMINVHNQKVQAVIICPTRELVQQIYQVSKELIGSKAIKAITLIGGKIDHLSQNQPHLVIGTVSRIKKLVITKTLKLADTKMLVVDECDMIFELGINQELIDIIQQMPNNIQKMAFSATIDQQLKHFFQKFWPNNQLISLDYQAAPPKVQHHLIVSQADKLETNLIALTKIINPFIALVFVNKISEALTVNTWLQTAGFKTGMLHGQLPARQRRQVLKNLQLHHYQYLVCTDLAARGLNLVAITDIISLKLPNDFKYYVHRAGRTGRETAIGNSYVFYDTLSAKQQNEFKKNHIVPKFYKINHNQLVLSELNLSGPTVNKQATQLTSKRAIAVINQFHHQKKVKPGYKKAFKTKIGSLAKLERKASKPKMIKKGKHRK